MTIVVTQTTIRPFSLLIPRMSDRQLVHSLLMKALPDGLSRQTPRADAKALWAWDQQAETLLIQAATELRSELLGEVIAQTHVAAPPSSGPLEVTVDLAVLKTPSADVPEEIRPILKAHGGSYRSRPVIVPSEERDAWVCRRLGNAGFSTDPSRLTLSPVAFADLGKRGGQIPYVSVRAVTEVSDTTSAANAIITGIGKGKNFGLGLLRTHPLESTSPAPTFTPKEPLA